MTLNAREIASRLRLHRAGRDWRGNCPCCGYRESFVLSDGKTRPVGWCASCEDNAAIGAALRGMDGWTPPPQAPGPIAPPTDKRAQALRLWAQGRPVPGTLAEVYLAARCVPEIAASPALRFLPACPHPSGARLLALLALIVDAAGEPLAVQRIFLAPDGLGKADIEPQRATLGPMSGGAVRIHPVAPELVIAEGIESAAAAGVLLGLPAWAAISAGNMARSLSLPEIVRRVVIAVDRDPPGERAADQAAARWRAEGRHVRLMLPNKAGQDANDILRARAVPHG